MPKTTKLWKTQRVGNRVRIVQVTAKAAPVAEVVAEPVAEPVETLSATVAAPKKSTTKKST